MKIYRFRILLDNEEDVFRDIDISSDARFIELHDIIVKAFEFSGMEMASFFASNEDWDKGEEIALMDMSDAGDDEVREMSATPLTYLAKKVGDKILYVYDFLHMWIFYVELVSVYEADDQKDLPKVVLSVGDAPGENPIHIETDSEDFEEDLEDDEDYGFGDDEGNEFESLDDYPDL